MKKNRTNIQAGARNLTGVLLNPIKTGLLAVVVASGLAASAQTTTTTTNFTVGATVPDDDPSGLASAKVVSTPIVNMTGVKVNVKLSGTFNGDIYCYLAHNGTNVILLNRVGRSASSSLGYSDKGFNLTFDDAAPNGDVHIYRTTLGGPISGPLTNSWAPDGRRTNPTNVVTTDPRTSFLNAFKGMNPNGQWVLFVADLAAGDIYTLDNWGIEITGYTPPSIVSAPANATVECSGTASFSVSANGTAPLSYQWRYNANPLPGATASSFTLNNASFANVGNYDVVITNNYGAITSAVATLTVQDTTAPVADAPSLSDVIAQCSATLPPAPTATDACDGQLVGVPDLLGPFGPGDTIVTWTFTDSHGNHSSQQQTIRVHDTIVPVITLLGSSPLTIECHGGYSDAGATASDNCDGNITSRIVTVNPVDANTPGTYTVTYNVSDAAGNPAVQVTRTVIVKDTTAPVPNVTPLPDVVAQCSVTLTAPKAIDACAGLITATTTDPLTYSAQGDYVVHWTYNDGNGNTSSQTQNVKVHDTTAPVITLLGSSSVTIECHSGYSDAGATASDNCDGNITSRIVTFNPVDANTPGTYTVTYNVSDAVGNPATQVTRTVIVQDTLAPVPNVTSLPDIIAQCSVTLTAPTATDACAGVITATTTDPLTYSAQGNYVVHWTYSDGNNNTASQTQNVKVHDTTAPVITLLGTNLVFVECHSGYTDAGATASDNCDGDITSRIVTVNTVNANSPGTNVVTYDVTDASGNHAVQVTRTVVVQDTIAPLPDVATLSDISVQCSVTLTAPTATDACAGTITASTTNALTYTAQGDYVVYWTYTDPTGNTSSQTQNVHVHDTTAPVITLLGSSSVTIECHSGYSDAGATASDNCDGNITSRIVTVNSVNPNAPGTYTVTYNVSDAVGNAAVQVTRTVIVRDTQAPVPDVTNLPNIIAQCSVTLVPPTATDACAGPITASTSDPLTYSTPGDYVVHWTYNDGNGNISAQTQNVSVHDTTAPVITLLGSSSVTVECHSGYTDAGATANDNCDGNITSHIVTVNPVDANTPGTYTVTYNVSDAAGNPAVQVSRTVIVRDTLPPVPDVTSLPDVLAECSVTLTAPTATDACSGAITATTTNALTYSAQGDYVVYWTYRDATGNTSVQAQNVKVHDVTAPVLTCPANITVFTTNTSGTAVTFTPTATDNCGMGTIVSSPDSGSNFPIGSNQVVTVTATDVNGNQSQCSFTVTVVLNHAPIAEDITMGAVQNVSRDLLVDKVLAHCFDLDDDFLTIGLSSATTTNGGTVTISSTAITYTPAPNFVGTDAFTYTVSDGKGGIDSATIVVVVHSAADLTPNITGVYASSPSNNGPSSFTLQFAGIPGFVYHIERATDLVTPNWTDIGSVEVPEDGLADYTDSSAPAGSAYYRTASPLP